MRPFYRFNMAAGSKKATLSIFDEIGPWGVSAQGFRAGLDSVKDASEIDVEINSFGGDLTTGLAIYNMLMASGKTVNVKVMGVAASAASLIMMAGSKRSMPKNTMVMVHNPMTGVYGNADDMREAADVLDKFGVGLHETYARVTGMQDEDLKAMLGKDTWLTADEALEHGFATEVTDEVAVQASFDVKSADLPDHIKALYAQATPPENEPPVVDITPEPAPVVPETPVAKAVHAAAITAGLDEAVATFLAVASDSETAGLARIKAATEISAICAFAKVPESAAALIRAGKTVVEARAEIVKVLAANDEHVITARKLPEPGAQPQVKSSTTVFEERAARKQRK